MNDIVELTLLSRTKGKWKERIHPTDDWDELAGRIDEILDAHGRDTRGSYQAVLKVNDGYAENKEDGATIVVNFKGTLDRIWDILNKQLEESE